jgi:WD domain, G-beta repeat
MLELKGHSGLVTSVSFSPDGTRIVTSSSDDTAKLWDAQTGTELLVLKLKGPGGLWSAWFSPDGTRIVTNGTSEGMAKVWDARTGQELKGEPIPPAPRSGLISPDGRWIAHAVGNRVELVALQPGAEELEYRRMLTRSDLERYREGYYKAKTAGDGFAAKFYFNLLPLPERTQQEALAAAEREISEGRTQAAIGPLATAYAADPSDTSLAIRVATLQAWFGQDQELADTGARALDFAKGIFVPRTLARVSRICCLRPTEDRSRRESALALARSAAKTERVVSWRYLRQLTLGIAEYRSGHFAEADAALIAVANDFWGRSEPMPVITSAF